MSRTAIKARLAWQERWHQPRLDQLLKPINAQRRKLIELIMSHTEQFEGLEQQIVWYGAGWHWTIQYVMVDPAQPQESDVLVYIVPKVDGPLVSVPLFDGEIAQLPMRRLNKMIRNGIRLAKCAVSVHWSIWSPTNQTEVTHINDLIKRKHKLAFGKPPASKAPAKTAKTAPKSNNGKK